MKKLLVILLLPIALTACGQHIADSVLIEGHTRAFIYQQPAGDINGGSLLFVMHGSGGNANDMIKYTAKLEAIAGKERLLIVYPEGYHHYWNECRKFATSDANKENINEQAFFNAMIEYFNKKYGIDKNKVFAAGTSGGGHMAYKLAFTMPTKVKAIAAIIANIPDSASCDCVLAGKALPVIIINGTADNVNPYNGGEMFVNKSSYGVVRSTENTFIYWATLAGYTGAPNKTLLPDTNPGDGKTIESYSYKQPNKPPVTLLKVIGGNHGYPNDIDVYLYVWDFFKSLP